MSRPKTYTFDIEVQPYELDSFGHVNHSRFLNYLESARWKVLKEEGIDLAHLKTLGVWPAIAQLDIKYLKPAYAGEILHVRSRLREVHRSTMKIDQLIEKAGVKITQAQVRTVLVDANGRPARFPEHLADYWKNLVHPEYLI